MANAVNNLRPLKWRGLNAPCSVIPTQFGHVQSPREYPYVDGEVHNWTGRKSHRVRATLYFLNTIEPGLYPGKWGAFRKALLDGRAGKLVHPDLGEFDARVEEGSYPIDANCPAGVIVDVSWVETRVDVDGAPPEFSIPPSDTNAAAAQCDACMAQLGIPYPTGTIGTSLADSLKQIATTLSTTPELYVGQVNALIATCDDIEDRFDAVGASAAFLAQPLQDSIVGDPARSTLLWNLYLLRDSLGQQAQQFVKQARATASAITTNDTSLSALADQYGQDLGDMIQLNPTLAILSLVPKGSTVTYYSGA